MNMDKNSIIKMVGILALVCLIVTSLTSLSKSNSLTLDEYAKQNPEIAYQASETAESAEISETGEATEASAPITTSESIEATASDITSEASDETTSSETNGAKPGISEANLQAGESSEASMSSVATLQSSSLIGASLNGVSVIDQRITYADSFYYEPLSDNLRRYITGVSFPAVSTNASEASTFDSSTENKSELAISYEELRYLHILHYDFEGNLAEGELICNEAIAQDLIEIFHELYRNEYQLEKVLLIDAYDGDDLASMEDNNTSCFNYRVVEGTTSLSKHALGLAIDVNPFYNPYITYEKDGSEKVSPAAAMDYADRDANFPYKIDENDLCYKLFIERGFTWGGNWNSCKDYQHFQKPLSN